MWKLYDDGNGHEREVIVLKKWDTEYFQLNAWFKHVLQHLFTRSRSLNNAFKLMYSATSSVSDFQSAEICMKCIDT